MANEINIIAGLTASKSGVNASMSGNMTTSMSTTSDSLIHLIQDVTTGAEDVELGDINTAAEYIVALRNLDSEAYIDVDFYSGDTSQQARIRAGETLGPIRMLPVDMNTLRVKASAGTVQMEVIACEAGNPAA